MAGTGVFNWPRPAAIAFDPLHKGAFITLTGTNLIATSAAGGIGNVRCTVGKSSGKWYWEIKITGGSTFGYSIGIINGATSSNATLGAATGVGSSYTFINFVGIGFKSTNGALDGSYSGVYNVVNTIVGVAFDATAGTIAMYINNVNQGVMYTGIAGTYYPAVGEYAANSFQYTANFAGPFVYTPPAGYIALTP